MIEAYAAINRKHDALVRSSSGGVFEALAAIVIQRNGVVFGCAYDDDMNPIHLGIQSIEDIGRLQGSKYAQSSIKSAFKEVEEHLKGNRWVLFSGTPCQVASLKLYLGQNYERLITADLICHGVPNRTFYTGYIEYLEKKFNGRVIDLNFRDKTKGWGHMEKVTYLRNGTIKSRRINTSDSWYHTYFLKGFIARQSCYECKFACEKREGDFTLGDFWGIEAYHPEIDSKEGVSALLINSEKGRLLVNELSERLYLTKTKLEFIKANNMQLNSPLKKSSEGDRIMELWRRGGYHAVVKDYQQKYRWQRCLNRIKRLVPENLKAMIRKLY